MSAPHPAVRLRGFTKAFGANRVLEALDLEVLPGQVFGYLGQNGAGKTTTVRILCGMLGAYDGEACVAGIDVADDPVEVKRRIGYLPESAELYGVLSIFEHLQLVGRLHELEDGLIAERAPALVRAFGLEERLHSRISTLSKGMRQKVLFCSALLHDPQVLFLDEPLSGLDVASTILVKELLRGLADRGKTIFYCSHMMDVVERVCDRIVILDAGRIVADGTFEELVERSGESHLETIFAELTGGADGKKQAQDVLAALGRDGS